MFACKSITGQDDCHRKISDLWHNSLILTNSILQYYKYNILELIAFSHIFGN
jgi:hypothetical protein